MWSSPNGSPDPRSASVAPRAIVGAEADPLQTRRRQVRAGTASAVALTAILGGTLCGGLSAGWSLYALVLVALAPFLRVLCTGQVVTLGRPGRGRPVPAVGSSNTSHAVAESPTAASRTAESRTAGFPGAESPAASLEGGGGFVAASRTAADGSTPSDSAPLRARGIVDPSSRRRRIHTVRAG